VADDSGIHEPKQLAGKRIAMSYWRLPDSALDEPDQACAWGRRALDVARAAAKLKKPKKAALKRP
jgi:DNA transformation protein